MRGILKRINRSNGGLPKMPVSGPVQLKPDRVEGDRWRNTRVHGGPKKAVLAIAAEAIDDLSARGYPVTYGSLGENLTVAGIPPQLWRQGQRFRIGPDATIEFTKLRTPCMNLDIYGPEIKSEVYDEKCRAGDCTSPRWAFGGFYARVIEPGLIQAGDSVLLISEDGIPVA